MIKVLFVCHGSIRDCIHEASKIKGFRYMRAVLYRDYTE